MKKRGLDKTTKSNYTHNAKSFPPSLGQDEGLGVRPHTIKKTKKTQVSNSARKKKEGGPAGRKRRLLTPRSPPGRCRGKKRTPPFPEVWRGLLDHERRYATHRRVRKKKNSLERSPAPPRPKMPKGGRGGGTGNLKKRGIVV